MAVGQGQGTERSAHVLPSRVFCLDTLIKVPGSRSVATCRDEARVRICERQAKAAKRHPWTVLLTKRRQLEIAEAFAIYSDDLGIGDEPDSVWIPFQRYFLWNKVRASRPITG